MPHDEDRPPGAGIENLQGPVGFERRGGIAIEEALQEGEECHKGVTPPEVEDDLLLDLSVLAHGLDHAHVLMHDAGGTGYFDGADKHDEVLSSWNSRIASSLIMANQANNCVYSTCIVTTGFRKSPVLALINKDLRQKPRAQLSNMG